MCSVCPCQRPRPRQMCSNEGTHHVSADKLPASYHVDPQPNDAGELPLGIVGQIVLQHALESFQLREHGEE